MPPWSHPVWVCGLKQEHHGGIIMPGGSHPVWVCGLKQEHHGGIITPGGVTPCMGVWIETKGHRSNRYRLDSHTLYGCVD